MHSYATTAQLSRLRNTGGVWRGARCNKGKLGSTECIGPFPFACGPFFALGVGTLDAFLHEQGSAKALSSDLQVIQSLPTTHRKVLEDEWLGSALWRFVGAASKINLFNIGLKPLYVDDARRFRGMRSVILWHNRLKYVRRLEVLYHFHTAKNGMHHCSLPVTWAPLKAHCCGKKNEDGRTPEGRRQSPLNHPWPVWLAKYNESERCKEQPELMQKYEVWKELGMRLEPDAVSLSEQA